MIDIPAFKLRAKGIQHYLGSVRAIIGRSLGYEAKPKSGRELSPVVGSLWDIGAKEVGLGVKGIPDKKLRHIPMTSGMANWPKTWENGTVVISNYGGDNTFLLDASETSVAFRVLEVRNNKKSGKSSEDKRRMYKDTLFLEPVGDRAGLYKVYAGEAWVELICDPPPPLYDDDEDYDDEWEEEDHAGC